MAIGGPDTPRAFKIVVKNETKWRMGALYGAAVGGAAGMVKGAVAGLARGCDGSPAEPVGGGVRPLPGVTGGGRAPGPPLTAVVCAGQRWLFGGSLAIVVESAALDPNERSPG